MQNFRYTQGLPAIPQLKQVTNRATGKRIYVTPEGKKYPSVTTILSEHTREAIDAWRKRVGNKRANYIAASAGQRGTRIHTLCEKYLKNEEVFTPEVSLFTKELFKPIIPLLHEIDNIHCQEQRLYSNHLRLAGTVDCIAEHDGRLSVIDFKTSSRRKRKEDIDHYFMQCAAYAIMYEELVGVPVNKLVVIIAHESDEPAVFVDKRNNFVPQLLHYRDLYEKNNPSFLDDFLDACPSPAGDQYKGTLCFD